MLRTMALVAALAFGVAQSAAPVTVCSTLEEARMLLDLIHDAGWSDAERMTTGRQMSCSVADPQRYAFIGPPVARTSEYLGGEVWVARKVASTDAGKEGYMVFIQASR